MARGLILMILGWSLLLQSLTKVIVVSNYLLHKQEIIVRYCENKTKPSMQCQGMCHLKKKLTEQDQKQENSRMPVLETVEVLWINDSSGNLLNMPTFCENYTYSNCLVMETIGFDHAVFHPPSGPILHLS